MLLTMMAPFFSLELAHVLCRSLSQPTKLLRAVSAVDVEKVDLIDGARASPMDMTLYNPKVCLKAVSSFLRDIWISERISRRLFTRLVVVDGARVCLSTACTNASELVSSGGDSECSVDICASVWSVSRLRRAEVSSSAIHRLVSAALLSSLDDMLAMPTNPGEPRILSKQLIKRAVFGV
jgi:hypothetical protein